MKYEVILNNKKYEIEVDECEEALTSVSNAAMPVAAPSVPSVPTPSPAVSVTNAEGKSVVSPMPGSILAVNVTQGQTVRTGEVLLVLEAMKMENDIVAPCDGIVKQILVAKGSTVDTDQVLLII